jgi:hypothetical protein
MSAVRCVGEYTNQHDGDAPACQGDIYGYQRKKRRFRPKLPTIVEESFSVFYGRFFEDLE